MPRREAGGLITAKLTLFAASDFALQPRNGLLLLLDGMKGTPELGHPSSQRLLLSGKLRPLPGELALAARVVGAGLRRA